MRRALIIALVAFVSVPALAVAQTGGEVTLHTPRHHFSEREVKSLNLSLAGLNLNNEQDAEKAVGKIRKGAERACTPGPANKRSLRDVRDYQECIDGAMKDAVAQTRSPTVQAVYDRAD